MLEWRLVVQRNDLPRSDTELHGTEARRGEECVRIRNLTGLEDVRPRDPFGRARASPFPGVARPHCWDA